MKQIILDDAALNSVTGGSDKEADFRHKIDDLYNEINLLDHQIDIMKRKLEQEKQK